MPRIITTLFALGALGLAGCASNAARSVAPAPVPGRIVLSPSDDAYQAALKSLSPAERETFRKGLGFTVDTLVVAPTPIETMAWSRRRPDTPAQVNISEFVRYLDQQPALKGPVRVNIATARVIAGIGYDQSTFGPQFRIQMEVEPSSTGVVSVTGFGGGPMCSTFKYESTMDSPELAKNSQIAFMKALLKTLLKINDQVLQG